MSIIAPRKVCCLVGYSTVVSRTGSDARRISIVLRVKSAALLVTLRLYSMYSYINSTPSKPYNLVGYSIVCRNRSVVFLLHSACLDLALYETPVTVTGEPVTGVGLTTPPISVPRSVSRETARRLLLPTSHFYLYFYFHLSVTSFDIDC
ncbi:hypothetical protein J6590_047507 [Homalodisca vitripennis]|nr:hypothetical protein J6590_047507 [Homalodisca vitripennis]